MKNLFALIIVLGMINFTFAQNDSIPEIESIPEIQTPEVDTSKNEKKDRKIVIRFGGRGKGPKSDTDRSRTRWLMLDYGFSTYLHKGKMNLPNNLDAMDQNLLGSSNWNFHIVQQRIRLDKISKVNIVYGATLEFNKYRFTNDYTLQPKQNEVTFTDEGVELTKNTLSASYLEIPVILNLRTKRNKHERRFDFKVGAYAGLLLSSKTRQKSDDLGKVKKRDDFNLNRVKYGLIARAGYGPFNLFVNYSFSPLFTKGEENNFDLQPLSFGLSIIPF